MPHVVSPKSIAETLTELWSPRVVAEVDDAYVKVARVKGTLTWHSHDDEDELFYILKSSSRVRSSCARARPSSCPKACATTRWPMTSAMSC
jgi:hypothetical protein